MDKQAAARDAYLRGRKSMEVDDVFEAIAMFEQATTLDPTRSEYFFLLGSCQARNPRWKKKAEENLLKAIELNPAQSSGYLALARLYKRGGLGTRSQEMYREVLRWDPSNEEAMAAVKPQGQSASGGLLGSLFKKT
jgi:tetratricopeptide (TPR) repeat protein